MISTYYIVDAIQERENNNTRSEEKRKAENEEIEMRLCVCARACVSRATRSAYSFASETVSNSSLFYLRDRRDGEGSEREKKKKREAKGGETHQTHEEHNCMRENQNPLGHCWCNVIA